MTERFKLKSDPVPLAPDSDPDFNEGTYVESPKQKKRNPTRKRPAKAADASDDDEYNAKPRARKRRGEPMEGVASGSKRVKVKRPGAPSHRRVAAGISSQNPLLEYFGDLGLQSASEGGSDDDFEALQGKQESEDDPAPSVASSEYESDASHAPEASPRRGSALPRTLAIVAAQIKAESQSREASQAGASTGADADGEDSVTEPESETEPELRASTSSNEAKRKIPPTEASSPPKKRRVSPGADDTSVTEPESEPENEVPPITQTTVAGTTAPDAEDSVTEPESESDPERPVNPVKAEEDSETEPESEIDEEDEEVDNRKKGRHPRPAFPLKPSQRPLGPLVLSTSHTHIPESPDTSEISLHVPPKALKQKPHTVQVPASINTYLRDYQRDGVKFFWERYQEGRGGLLGDDMGLGKTIQIIAFLAAIMQKHGDARDVRRRHNWVSRLQDSKEWREHRRMPQPPDARWPTALIVAPSSVVGNWEREFETWGYFEVGMYTTSASAEERDSILRDFKLGRLDVVLTTFDLARRDMDFLDDLPWSCIFVDEAHRVKNPRSKLTEAFHRFKCLRRFGVTGTAIQNTYSELWTILDWTNPGMAGTKKQWEGYVAQPLTRGQSKSASEEEKLKAVMVAKILKEKFLPKLFLRRTKDLIKDQLPKKTDEVVFCPLGPKQIEVYRRIVESEPVQNMVRKDEYCECGSKKRRKSCCHPYDKADLFKYMSTLIKISNHLALILPSPTDTPEQVARNRALSELAFPHGDIPSYGPAMLVPRYCGKWMVLETLLKEWRKDLSNKVLIFTKSVKLLEMLEFHLKSQNLGFVKLDGSTKQSDRMPMIDKFHEDPDVFVFLISTLAGGTGLNLTGANKVVIFDPNWNPAHDLQAMDRAYRYGQTRDVSVYRLLGAGSLEELIYARQVYKQQQMAVGYDASLQTRYFEGVQGDKQRQGELFGIKNIFALKDGAATKMAIERATLVDLDWALANMEAKTKQPAAAGKAKWVYEAEAKGKKEEGGELRGLGALLFDDDAPVAEHDDDDISKTLKDIGVDYTHRNENLIAENAIEVEKMKALMEKKRSSKPGRSSRTTAKSQGKRAKSKSPDRSWPPKRKHHKPPQTPQEKLISRRMALIELGIISTPAEVYHFAQNFVHKSVEEQQELLNRLDRHVRRSSPGGRT